MAPHIAAAMRAAALPSPNPREMHSVAHPGTIKSMGRKVQNFDQVLWNNVVCSVAYEVVYQKFQEARDLENELLVTED